MIDFSRIKMPKLVFMPHYKSWFKGLGLHHASITAACIALFWLFGISDFGAMFAIGWYGSREYGNGPYPPKSFEVMDFVSPLIVSVLWLVF